MAQYITWGAWTATSIAAATITNGSSDITAAIPMDNKVAAQIGIALTYGATKTENVRVYVRENINGNDGTQENSFSIAIEGATTQSHYRELSLSSMNYVEPKIEIVNDSGSSITNVSVFYRNAEVGST